MTSAKFILGTANLGSMYGVNNTKQYSRELSKNVLQYALSRGVTTIDTAADYGNAEELIGESMNSNAYPRIITKIPSRATYSYEYVSKCLDSSLEKLKQSNIHGLMFHDSEIHTKREITEISKKLLGSGKVEHIGFSAYSLDAVLKAKAMNPNWTIFQVPENILDRRLYDSSDLVEMADSGNLLFVRSIFLQGLLVLNSNDLPERFRKYRGPFQSLQLLAENSGVNALDLCLSYSSQISWSSGSIVAADSIQQLDEILDFNHVEVDFEKLERLPEIVLDPRRWGELN
jgi:aryl-alcohol dehydrogenase-like predicted oxidoreductase